MKANEAPKRIWINSPQDLPCGTVDSNSVEYVRKDAFIEKANEFISTFFHPDDTELIDAVLNRFHEHMKFK